jgi:hypothetical protein
MTFLYVAVCMIPILTSLIWLQYDKDTYQNLCHACETPCSIVCACSARLYGTQVRRAKREPRILGRQLWIAQTLLPPQPQFQISAQKFVFAELVIYDAGGTCLASLLSNYLRTSIERHPTSTSRFEAPLAAQPQIDTFEEENGFNAAARGRIRRKAKIPLRA